MLVMIFRYELKVSLLPDPPAMPGPHSGSWLPHLHGISPPPILALALLCYPHLSSGYSKPALSACLWSWAL